MVIYNHNLTINGYFQLCLYLDHESYPNPNPTYPVGCLKSRFQISAGTINYI